MVGLNEGTCVMCTKSVRRGQPVLFRNGRRGLELCRTWRFVVGTPVLAATLGAAYASWAAGLTRRSRWSRAPSRSSALVRFTTGRRWFFCARGWPASGAADRRGRQPRPRGLGAHPPAGGAGERGPRPCLTGDVASAGGANEAEGYYREALALGGELGMRPLVAHCHFGPRPAVPPDLRTNEGPRAPDHGDDDVP